MPSVRVNLITLMYVIRRRLSWLVAGWLLCQISGLATSPVLVAVGIDQDACCRNLAPGQTCPMHHKKANSNDRTCKMRSACQPPDAALVSMSGGIGVLPHATDVVITFAVGQQLDSEFLSTLSRARRSDAPPPRS
jgi:hypothetical protein